MWAEPNISLKRMVTGQTHDRDEFFTALHRVGIEEVEVVGVAADYSVRWAVEG